MGWVGPEHHANPGRAVAPLFLSPCARQGRVRNLALWEATDERDVLPPIQNCWPGVYDLLRSLFRSRCLWPCAAPSSATAPLLRSVPPYSTVAPKGSCRWAEKVRRAQTLSV